MSSNRQSIVVKKPVCLCDLSMYGQLQEGSAAAIPWTGMTKEQRTLGTGAAKGPSRLSEPQFSAVPQMNDSPTMPAARAVAVG